MQGRRPRWGKLQWISQDYHTFLTWISGEIQVDVRSWLALSLHLVIGRRLYLSADEVPSRVTCYDRTTLPEQKSFFS